MSPTDSSKDNDSFLTEQMDIFTKCVMTDFSPFFPLLFCFLSSSTLPRTTHPSNTWPLSLTFHSFVFRSFSLSLPLCVPYCLSIHLAVTFFVSSISTLLPVFLLLKISLFLSFFLSLSLSCSLSLFPSLAAHAAAGGHHGGQPRRLPDAQRGLPRHTDPPDGGAQHQWPPTHPHDPGVR